MCRLMTFVLQLSGAVPATWALAPRSVVSCICLQMNLARHSISSTDPLVLYDVRFDPDAQIFATSTPDGFALYRTLPLDLLRKRGNCRPTISTTSSLITH